MKTRYPIAVISFLVVLGVIAIYLYHENQDSSVLTQKNDKTDRTGQFFREMGFIRVDPAAGPLDVLLQDLDGGSANLSQFKGKIVFLNFWTTWCQACREEVPSMSKLFDKLKNSDFAMVAVNLREQASVVRKFVREFNLSFTVLLDLDGNAKSLFGVGTIPTTFILDKEGRIIGSAIGAREWDSEKSLTLFRLLTDEEAAPRP